MPEPTFAVPLSALVEVFRRASSMSEWSWSCILHGREDDWEHSGSAPSESAARAAAISHLATVHGIHAAEEPAEFSWIAIADQCRRFVRAHDDDHVDATILGSILGNLRVAAGLPAVFPGDSTGIDRAARVAELKRWIDAYEGHEYPDPGDESDYNLGFLAVVDDLKRRIAELEAETDEPGGTL